MAVEMTQELPATGTVGDEGHCEVLQGADGPVYFLHQGLLFIVHDLLGRWVEPGEVHWLVSASVGRFGEPALYRLRCRYAAVAIAVAGIGEYGGVDAADAMDVADPTSPMNLTEPADPMGVAGAMDTADTKSARGETGASGASGAGLIAVDFGRGDDSRTSGARRLDGQIGPSDPYLRPGPARWTVRRAANGAF
jgi:hypothetical protein